MAQTPQSQRKPGPSVPDGSDRTKKERDTELNEADLKEVSGGVQKRWTPRNFRLGITSSQEK
jgi:hypothetical protein